MKTYKELISELKGRKPKGDVVFDKKVKRIPVLITKEKGSLPFVVYIDNTRLHEGYVTKSGALLNLKQF